MVVHLKIEGQKDHEVPDGSTVWITGQWMTVEVSLMVRTTLVNTAAELREVLEAPLPQPDFLRTHPAPTVARQLPLPGVMPTVKFTRGATGKYQAMLDIVWDAMSTGGWHTTSTLVDSLYANSTLVVGRPRTQVAAEIGYLMGKLSVDGLVEKRPLSPNSKGGVGSPQKYRRADR